MIAVLIPARKGSKRVPNKNMRLIDGLPVLGYSVSVGLSLPGDPPVYVSTDCEEAGAFAQKWGAVYIGRPPEFATDEAEDVDVVEHFIADQVLRGGRVPKYLVYLRPTTPNRNAGKVARAIEEFISLSAEAGGQLAPTSLRSVHEMSESAFKCAIMTGNLLTPIGKVEDFNRPDQVYMPTYKPNGYVDIIRTDFKGRDLWGPRIMGFLTKPVIEIDTEFEFDLLKTQMERG